MQIVILFLIVAITINAQQLEEAQSQKLHLCDRIVGAYIDTNRKEIDRQLESYEDISNRLVNYFYHMMTNCYLYLNETYYDSTIDIGLIQEYDWISIIKPINFNELDDQQPLNELNESEQNIKAMMIQEKVKIGSIKQPDNIITYIQMVFDATGYSYYQISIMFIIIIMTCFFISLCYSLSVLIKKTNKDQQQKKVRSKLKAK